MRRRRGPGLVRVAATTAVVAGTVGAVSHHQQNKYADKQQQAAYEAQAQQDAIDQAAANAVAAQQAQQAQYAPATRGTRPG